MMGSALRSSNQIFLVPFMSGLNYEIEVQKSKSKPSAKNLTNLEKHNKVLNLLASAKPLAEILKELALEIEEEHPEMICSILLLDKEGKHLLHCAAPSLPENYNQAINYIRIGPEQGSCGTAAWRGERVIVTDIKNDPLWSKFAGLALANNLHACWSQPIIAADENTVLGTFAIYYRQVKSPKPEELEYIKNAAAIAGIAISQHRTQDELRYRVNFEKLIFSISNKFISCSSEQIDDVTINALQELAEFTASNCTYILLKKGDKSLITYCKWQKTSINFPNNEYYTDLPETHLAKLIAKINDHEIILLNEDSKDVFLKENHSLLAIPILSRDQAIGYLALENCNKNKDWSIDEITLLKMFAQIFVNALSRKETEEELYKSREQIFAKQEQLRLTFDNTQIGMATCTLNGKFLSVNNALCKMLGRTAAELLQMSFNDIAHPEDRNLPRKKLIQLLRGKTNIVEIEKRYFHKNGSLIFAKKRLGVVFDSLQKPLYLVAEVEDITEKKKWEEEYLKACKLESLGILAGGIAHDFNNILMGLLGNVSHSKHIVDKESKIYLRLSEIEKAIYRAKDLTQQLLTFSKGGTPVKKTTVISEIIKDIINFSLSGSNVTAELSTQADLLPANVDAGQISQVINNLMINSCQAMPDGGKIHVQCENFEIINKNSVYGKIIGTGKYIKITISDTGCGIPTEHLQKIFDPFFTTKQGGSGLGLATTYSIIKKHQGHIEVDSLVGVGTTFTIFLPSADKTIKDLSQRNKNVVHGYGRVLIMDDETMVREVTARMLQYLGYDVLLAADGQETIEIYKKCLAENKFIDAVIMDLTIPGGQGGEVTIQKLKNIDPKVRAILSSGYSDKPIMSNYSSYGFYSIMTKPYDLLTLSNTLNNILGRSLA